MKPIVFTASAARQIDDLPEDARSQVLGDLDRYAVAGTGDVKTLSGREGYRLRSGRYRVLFSADRTTVLAIYVGKRETATYR